MYLPHHKNTVSLVHQDGSSKRQSYCISHLWQPCLCLTDFSPYSTSFFTCPIVGMAAPLAQGISMELDHCLWSLFWNQALSRLAAPTIATSVSLNPRARWGVVSSVSSTGPYYPERWGCICVVTWFLLAQDLEVSINDRCMDREPSNLMHKWRGCSLGTWGSLSRMSWV